MKVLVLGGCGLQGKAVLHDLSHSDDVDEIVCADLDLSGLEVASGYVDLGRIEPRQVDLTDFDTLVALMNEDVDVVIDVLPARFLDHVAEAAVAAGVSVVNTMYGHMMDPALDQKAKDRGITIMPESGLDPGIDLVLCGYGASRLDEVHELHSLCGGFPGPSAIDNPLKYKISWTFDGVLKSYKRPAVMVRRGETIRLPASQQHDPEWIESIDFPGIGELESIPNGDALVFAEHLGVADTVREATRRTLRWPGHSELWRVLADLGFLGDEPVPGLPCEVTPHEFMVKHLEPRLQYHDDERDLVVMRNIVAGLQGSEPTRITFDMVDQRDLATGLLAMNRTVGFTASIVAQLITTGQIQRRGLLTAVRDIPPERFLAELHNRGIQVIETVVTDKEDLVDGARMTHGRDKTASQTRLL